MTSDLALRDETALVTDVSGLLDEWLTYRRVAGNASEKTLEAYRKGMTVFLDWLRDTGNQGNVTPATVVAYKAFLQERYGAQTVNLRLSAVRSFYRWCVTTERLTISPAASIEGVKRPNSRQHKRDALTDGEVVAVLASCNPGTLDGARDLAMLMLMAYCGLREVEIYRANIGNLRTQGERLVLDVHGKGRTEADETAVIPVSQEGVIRRWLTLRLSFRNHADGDPLFISLSKRNTGERLSTRAIRAIVRRHYNAAGVAGTRKTAHSLRHSAITSAIRHGATPLQVQTMARHTSFDTTLAYIHEEARTANPAEDLVDFGG